MKINDPTAMTRQEADEILREEMRFVGCRDILSGRKAFAGEILDVIKAEEPEMAIGRSEGARSDKV